MPVAIGMDCSVMGSNLLDRGFLVFAVAEGLTCAFFVTSLTASHLDCLSSLLCRLAVLLKKNPPSLKKALKCS